MTNAKPKLNIDNESETLGKISEAINAIKTNTGFGSIEIVIHDSNIVQIEQREKIRFSNTNLNKK
ncbi:MAG: YezD family protein [Methylophilaceae bacterium]|nr:MAG: YezD family protein [Methylophilaceae bacterium]